MHFGSLKLVSPVVVRSHLSLTLPHPPRSIPPLRPPLRLPRLNVVGNAHVAGDFSGASRALLQDDFDSSPIRERERDEMNQSRDSAVR